MIVLPSERRGRGYDSIESCALPLSQTLLAVVLFLPLSPPIDQRQDRDRIARLRQRPITWGASEVRIGLSAGGRWIRTIGTPPNFLAALSIPAQFTFRNITVSLAP